MKVAIVGGGIGGLTAALALARHDVDVEVYEQASEIPVVGASLQLGPNALRLLAELGLLPQLRGIGVLPDAVDLVRWDDGSLLHRTTLGSAMEEHFGAPQLDFFRPDLHRLLVDALPPGALRLGARVDGVQHDAESASLLLAGGARVRADVEDVHPEHVNYYWLGPHRHGVSYWISGGELLAVNCAVQDAEWSRESWTLEAPAAEALAHFEGWHEPLLERMRRCPMFLRGAVFIRPPLAHWSFGRVTLLGDAAHAMEPFQAQGAAQAVEDAYVLAACLASSRDDVTGALARYEAIRMGRAEDLQSSSHTAANVFYLPDGEEQRARDAAYAILHETQPWGPRQRIWEYDVRSALAAVT